MSKVHTPPGFLKKPDETWTDSCSETLKSLMSTHFPGCVSVTSPMDRGSNISATSTIGNQIVDSRKVAWAIDSFSAYKSAGPDGIIPIMLQCSKDVIVPILVDIFRGCLNITYIPTGWREVNVIFIPKAGKPTHTEPKDFRPISLSSFLLKTLERLIETHIRLKLNDTIISQAQHAYVKGKSVETALHEVVGTIENSIQFKEFTLAAFLDIEGAFNNVDNHAIRQALDSVNVNPTLSKWIDSMLQTRLVNAEMGDSKLKVRTCRGTPQGGVLSPLLWLLVVNQILKKLSSSGIKVVAYADDIVIMASGKYIPTLCDLLQTALNKLSNWASGCGLNVNPTKTELVLFTRKNNIPMINPPTINGTPLQVSSAAKYLGVVLDHKLNWKENIRERERKASIAFYTCSRIFGRKWGPSPKTIHWMYTAIVRPILTYGCLVWWPALGKAIHLRTMTKIQRLACIGTTSAMRTTPTAALETFLSLAPLDLFTKETAAKSALRLRQCSSWVRGHSGHRIIMNYTDIDMQTDYITPHIDFDPVARTDIPTRECWTENRVINEDHVSVFTDGSKTKDGVGSGIFSDNPPINKSLKLPDFCSVFQAEVLAVCEAANYLATCEPINKNIDIFIDSQAAIKAISSIVTKSKLVNRCRNELKLLNATNPVTLRWVPGHRDIHGNEMADQLAKTGSSLEPSQTVTSIYMPLESEKNKITNDFLKSANDRWSSIDTCRVSRNLWPEISKKKTEHLLGLSRPQLSLLVGILTGHNTMGTHMSRMGISTSDLCRGCQDEEAEEDSFHFLCECPSLARTRKVALGEYFFDDLGEISKKPPRSILKFIQNSGWFREASIT